MNKRLKNKNMKKIKRSSVANKSSKGIKDVKKAKSVSSKDIEEIKSDFRIKRVSNKKMKSVRKGKMEIDTEQMLNDLIELGRIKPVEQKKIKEKNLKKELFDLPKSPLRKMIEKGNSSILKISAVFFSIVVLFVFSLVYVFGSKTFINITLKRVPNDVNIQRNFSLFNDKDSLRNNDVIAIYTMARVDINDEYIVDVKRVESDIAEGSINIINNSNEGKTFVNTTRFISNVTGNLYRLKETVSIPALSTISATVYADNKDIEGESANTRFTIPGLKSEEAQKVIYGETSESFGKGVTNKSVVNSEDVLKASDMLDIKLKQKVVEELRDKIKDKGELEFIPTGLTYNISNKNIDGDVGDEVSKILISGTIDAKGVLVDRNKILNLVKGELLSQNTNGYVINIDENCLEFDIIRVDFLTRDLSLDIKAKVYTSYDMDRILNKKDILGMEVNNFYDYVSDVGFANRVSVVNFPFWNSKITKIKDNIIIRVK